MVIPSLCLLELLFQIESIPWLRKSLLADYDPSKPPQNGGGPSALAKKRQIFHAFLRWFYEDLVISLLKYLISYPDMISNQNRPCPIPNSNPLTRSHSKYFLSQICGDLIPRTERISTSPRLAPTSIASST